MQIFFVLMYKICAFQEKYRLCSPEIQADCTYGNKMLRFYPKSARFLDIHSRFFCIWKMRVLYRPIWRKIPHFYTENCISEEILFPYVQIMPALHCQGPRVSLTMEGSGCYPRSRSRSSSTVPIPAMPNCFTSTSATPGLKKAGRVGPRWIFFTPRCRRASSTMTAFCSYQEML